MSDDEILDLVLGKLDGVRPQPGGRYMARCPAHDDGNASLSVGRGTEQPVVLHCHAGCDTADVLAKIGLATTDISSARDDRQPDGEWMPGNRRSVAVYDYTDERGKLLFQVLRRADKRFVQRRPDPVERSGWAWNMKGVTRVPYRLPAVRKAATGKVAGRVVYIVEGEKDVHAVEAEGAVATCNPMGAGKWLPGYGKYLDGIREAVIVADRDDPGQAHALQVAERISGHVLSIRIVEAAEGKDAADHLAAGYGLEDFVPVDRSALSPAKSATSATAATTPGQAVADTPAASATAPVARGATDNPGELLGHVRRVYQKWLGADYDTQALDAVLCTAAAGKLGGDPPWLLVVGGSGAAKTETISPLAGSGAIVVSTISGEAALLSGTSDRDRAKDATGGLLRTAGDSGTLIVKDFTSILSMNRDTRALVLAALREIYDGHWSRNVGTDGGRTLTWKGRLVLIGAVTTAWDSAYQVVSAMGDRFVLVRLASDAGERLQAGRQAMRNVSSEADMRAELAAAVTDLLAAVDPGASPVLGQAEQDSLLDLADIVTRARTPVERDFQGNPQWAHALEMPTRFAKQLVQVTRGGIALGMALADALAVAARCARDSMPPVRQKILSYVAGHPKSPTADVVRGVQMPRQTVDRTLQELQLLGLLTVDGVPYGDGGKTRWIYSLALDVSGDTLAKFTRDVSTPTEACAGCGNQMTVVEPGRRYHPICEPDPDGVRAA